MTPPGPSRLTGIVVVVVSSGRGVRDGERQRALSVQVDVRDDVAVRIDRRGLAVHRHVQAGGRAAVAAAGHGHDSVGDGDRADVIGCGESAVAAVAKSNPTAQPINAADIGSVTAEESCEETCAPPW